MRYFAGGWGLYRARSQAKNGVMLATDRQERMGRAASVTRSVALALTLVMVAPATAIAATRALGHQAHKASGSPARMLMGIGNPPGCVSGADPTRVLAAYHATVLHEIIDPRHAPAGMVPCLAAAVAHRYRVTVAIQYWNGWTIAHDAAYFKTMLALVAPYAWAISIGNEQDINTGGRTTPARYAATWRAIEPIVARLAPHALRVAGEISPWGEQFLKAAWKDKLPGAQVIAAHPYLVKHAFSIAEFVRWCASIRKPVWFTEGMLAPKAWTSSNGAPVPRSQFRGVALGVAWLAIRK